MEATSGTALELKTGVPTYQVEDEEGRIHLLLRLPIAEEGADGWCLWRPDLAGFSPRSIFESALIEGQTGIDKNALKSDLSACQEANHRVLCRETSNGFLTASMGTDRTDHRWPTRAGKNRSLS